MILNYYLPCSKHLSFILIWLQAEIFCKQLGFLGAEYMSSGSYFGKVSSDYAVEKIHCKGTEHSLDQCHIHDSGKCKHTEAAGVICKSKTLFRLFCTFELLFDFIFLQAEYNDPSSYTTESTDLTKVDLSTSKKTSPGTPSFETATIVNPGPTTSNNVSSMTYRNLIKFRL